MTPEQLDAYYRSDRGGAVIRIDDLDVGDHTLTTGYNINGEGYVHVYVMGAEIHLLVHDGKQVLHHERSDEMPAVNLRPSKRAYPHTTNETFALIMRGVDEPLTFLGNFNWDEGWVRTEMALEPFKAPTHLDF